MLLALKIDVDTLARHAREGVPNLVLLLKKARRRRHVPLLARPRSHRTSDQARVPAGFFRQGCAARRSWATTA